jgi:hypothetical protein
MNNLSIGVTVDKSNATKNAMPPIPAFSEDSFVFNFKSRIEKWDGNLKQKFRTNLERYINLFYAAIIFLFGFVVGASGILF